MARNSGEQTAELSLAAVKQQDSKQITDLIQQLDRDLEETQRKSAKDS